MEKCYILFHLLFSFLLVSWLLLCILFYTFFILFYGFLVGYRWYEHYNSWTYFGIFLIVVLLGSDPPAHQVVTHGVGESKVVIPFGCHISVLDQRKMEMPVESDLQFCDIFHTSKTSHGDLLPFIVVWQWFWHDALPLASLFQYNFRCTSSQFRYNYRSTHMDGSCSPIYKSDHEY